MTPAPSNPLVALCGWKSYPNQRECILPYRHAGKHKFAPKPPAAPAVSGVGARTSEQETIRCADCGDLLSEHELRPTGGRRCRKPADDPYRGFYRTAVAAPPPTPLDVGEREEVKRLAQEVFAADSSGQGAATDAN